jgi:hypothetical protein
VDRVWIRIALFLVVCLAVGMVSGACRATTLRGIVRKSIEQFASLAALMIGLSIGLWLLSLVAQA